MLRFLFPVCATYVSYIYFLIVSFIHFLLTDSPSALSAMPDLAAHYGSVGSGMYPPYMSVLTNNNNSGVVVDGSSLLSHGVLNSSHPQHNSALHHEHRIYELHKGTASLLSSHCFKSSAHSFSH